MSTQHSTPLLLVVDDYELHRDLMVKELQGAGYRTATAKDGFEALEKTNSLHPDLVLLDVNMPRLDGLQVLAKMRQNPQTRLLPVILVTGQFETEDKVRGFDAGASDFLGKPWDPPELVARVRAHLRVRSLINELEGVEQVLYMLAKVVEVRDAYTLEHTGRVASYAQAIAEAIHLGQDDQSALHKGALLHDIGKIGIPDAILRKPGPLSEDEWRQMRRHPEIGVEITSRLHSMGDAFGIIRSHHERWDGNGYPDGLAGEAIPCLARIVAVADSFDAITSDRPYHRRRSFREGLDLIRQGGGKEWDPEIAQVASSVLPTT